MKGKLKTNKGITLVALVVTIVVLIILATVSIDAVFSENGIIKKSQLTRDMQTNSVTEEEQDMNRLIEEYANMMETESIPKTPFEEAQEDSMLTKEENTKLKIGSDTVYIPAGFKIHADSAGAVDEGIVITDGTNEFVWVPVSEESFGNMFNTAEPAVVLSGSTGVSSSYYSNLRVRSGDSYTVATVSNGAYSSTSTIREPDLVTDYDEDTTNKYYEQAGYESSEEMAQGFVDDYTEMRESIKTYGGFYVGRYELTGTVDNPTVQAGEVLDAGSAEAGNWYGLYKACRNVVTGNEHAVTTMIWGCQWDETVNWLKNTLFKNDIEAVDIDSSSWGNYSDYNTTNGYEEGDERYIAGAGSKQNTGYSEYWSANKIYDLAGNCYDFTQEAHGTSGRVGMGGSYYNSGSLRPLSMRDVGNSYVNYNYDTARVTLYIK